MNEPLTVKIIHPFAEHFDADARAVTLEETAARYIVLLTEKPRARDVFDLWFILNHGWERLNLAVTHELARELAAKKGNLQRQDIEPAHRLLLGRAWEGALGDLPGRPTFAQAEEEIKAKLVEILP